MDWAPVRSVTTVLQNIFFRVIEIKSCLEMFIFECTVPLSVHSGEKKGTKAVTAAVLFQNISFCT